MAVERWPAGLEATPAARDEAKIKVGLVGAFTGHYDAVKVLARFLQLMGVEVVTSAVTTPEIMAEATTYASADLCLPLRVYVGHVKKLLDRHQDLNWLLAPNVWSEDGRSSTCAKYRDIGGVALRSLCGTVPYLMQRQPKNVNKLAALIGPAATAALASRRPFPRLLMPNIRSLDPAHMRNVCYNVYADIMGWPRWRKAATFLPQPLRRRFAPVLSRIYAAVEEACRAVLEGRGSKLAAKLADPSVPRLAVVGRPYLVQDATLTCDLVRWFTNRGVAVITSRDVPPSELHRDRVRGFYDSHKEGQAFIDWARDKVDGCVCVGSFGCHPDAFQLDYLADYARSHGLPCWNFRYDEMAGHTGFHTRYETILSFLAEKRDQRLRRSSQQGRKPPVVLPLRAVRQGAGAAATAASAATTPTNTAVKRTPLFIWPYMGEVLSLGMEELAHQFGLSEYIVPPAPVTAETLLLGNDRYTETCSPYACSTGSLKQTLLQLTERFEQAAAAGQQVEPRRIILLMLQGEGPCTFGWYAIAQNKHLPEEFGPRLAPLGHTVEMATVGMSDVYQFLQEVYAAGGAPRLRPVLNFLAGWGQRRGWRVAWAYLRFYFAFRALSRPVWAKLDAAERLRARSLILRAHERQPGAVAAAYAQGLELLRQAHTPAGIRRAERQARALLAAVPADTEAKPRIVSVGEIYVALTSYANRGTVEHLFAREGVEIVEGITLSKFVRHSLREMQRRALRKVWPLRPLLAFLHRHHIDLLEERLRDPYSRPFLVHEVGGEGVPTTAAARRLIEAGCDGILHVHPFKCMPEAISKDALKEIADLYNVRYLALSFDKETEIERLRTEVSTYATLLHAQLAAASAAGAAAHRRRQRREVARRRAIGRWLDVTYRRCMRGAHVR